MAAQQLHAEVATALEIALRTGRFEVGTYRSSDRLRDDWERVH